MNPEELERKNRRLWDAEELMSETETILHEESEKDPSDTTLKELEARFYRLWSDYLSYLDTKPYTAKERANVEWTAGRIGRQVLARIFGEGGRGERGVIPEALDSKYTWFHSPSGDRLHYVPEAANDYGFWERACSSDGSSRSVAICGLEAEWVAPGLFSRLGMPCCKRCCEKTGIPHGDGTPFNAREDILEKLG